MIKTIKKIITDRKNRNVEAKKNNERQILIKKVERGTDFAIREYGDVLRKLAEYDRQ